MSFRLRERGSAFATALAVALGAALLAPSIGAAAFLSPAGKSLSLQGGKFKKFSFTAGISSSEGANGQNGEYAFLSKGRTNDLETHNLTFEGGKLKLNSKLSSGSWKGSYGKTGKVSLKFKATKALKRTKPSSDCRGGDTLSRVGRVTGTLKLNMGAYFKTIKLSKARATATSAPEMTCGLTPIPQGPDENKDTSLFAGGERGGLSVVRTPGGKVTQQMFLTDGKINRSITRTSNSPGDFAVADNASTATVKGIAGGFSGTLNYTATTYFQNGSAGTATGNLTADFVTGREAVVANAPVQASLQKPGFTPPPPPNQPPNASFSSFQTYDVAFEVQFNDGSYDPDGNVVGWSWNFGDGATSTLKDPKHAYSAAGNYTVTLTVTDDRGGTATTNQQITVQPPESEF